MEEAQVNLPPKNSPEYRKHFLVPFMVMSEGVPSYDLDLVREGIQDVVEASGQVRELAMLGNESLGNGPFMSGRWYIGEALKTQTLNQDKGYGRQLDYETLWRLVHADDGTSGIQKEFPHLKILVTNTDLTGKMGNGEYANFGFGITDQTLPFSVLSLVRFNMISGHRQRAAVIRQFVRHEVSHLFGIPARDGNVEDALGKHCADSACTMFQSHGLVEAVRQSERVDAAGRHFCNDCIGDFKKILGQYRPEE